MISEEEFNARVDLLRRKDPTNALLPSLRSYSRAACIYLRHAMRGLEIEDEEEARPQVQEEDEGQAVEADDPHVMEMSTKMSQLYGRRFNLSNQFHEHTYTPGATERNHDTTACANISDELRGVQLKIGRLQRKLYHYKRTGELIDEAPAVERQYEGLELSRRYRTVQQNVRRWRTRIEREGPQQEVSIRQKWDKKLKEYEHELEVLKRQIRQEVGQS